MHNIFKNTTWFNIPTNFKYINIVLDMSEISYFVQKIIRDIWGSLWMMVIWCNTFLDYIISNIEVYFAYYRKSEIPITSQKFLLMLFWPTLFNLSNSLIKS